jgi:hypothetical protein
MDDSDPRSVIFSFLDGLPQTIRTEAFLFVMLYAMEVDIPEDSGAFVKEVKTYLKSRGDPPALPGWQ